MNRILEKYGYTLAELCYRIRNNIDLDKIFKCKYCGNIIKLKSRRGFSKFCSRSCGFKWYANSNNVLNVSQLKFIKEKKEKTNIKNWGCKNVFQNTIIKNKSKNTLKQLYGTEFYSQSNDYKDRCSEIQNKIFKTKLINNTVKYSKAEQDVYKLLKDNFKEVLKQYKSEEYPFNCDFYIKDINTYIECNFHFSHGKDGDKILGFFNKDNPEHIKLLEKWKSKNTKFYKNTINVWTVRDPLKLEIAKKNNLNYVVFWDKKLTDVKKWLTLK